MTGPFAPPELLALHSCTVDGSDPDEQLAPGVHLRILAGLDGAFPLAPFVVWSVPSYDDDVTLIDVEPRGDTTRLVRAAWRDEGERCTVGLHLDPGGGPVTATVLGRDGRELARCDREPYEIDPGRDTLVRLDVGPDGDLAALRVRRIVISDYLAELDPERVLARLDLPVAGTGAMSWYAGGCDHPTALDRAANGAPPRPSPMDDPTGTLALDDPASAERERAEALLADGAGGPGVRALLDGLVTGDVPPWAQTDTHVLTDDGAPIGARTQRAELARLGALQTAAIDPTIARYLGFAHRLDVPARSDGRTRPLVVAGLLAVDPDLDKRNPHLRAWLSARSPEQETVRDRLLAALGPDLAAEVDDLRRQVVERGYRVRAVLAASAPLRPWFPPVLGGPETLDHRWQTPRAAVPSTSHRATLAFPDERDAAMVAVARSVGDGPQEPQHGALYVPGPPGRRGAPRLLGRESDPAARVRGHGSSGLLDPAAIVAEQDIPAEDGPVTYAFRGADLLGRFGEPSGWDGRPPPRPAPPVPVLRHHLDLPDHIEGLPPTGLLSPGRLLVETTVPAIDELAAGSRPIAAVVVDGGEPQPVDPGPFRHEIVIDPLPPQGRLTRTVTVRFVDTDDVGSPAASATVTVHDRRLPEPVDVAAGLFWTSTPGPDPDVTLALTWTSPPHATHRVYVADQAAFTDGHGTPRFPADTSLSRATIADRGVTEAPVPPRERFRLLPDLVRADGHGRAELRTELPRSLRTVQFLRVVPVTEQGAEAPFDRCPLVPVAVPDDRRPPAPRLDGTVDPDTGLAGLAVLADGLDSAALRRDEPGLFRAGTGSAEPPRFRIRRAVARPRPRPGAGGPIPHPAYARPIPLADDALVFDPAAAVFGGFPPAGPLEPFVRFVFWAEARMPPEHRLRPGAARIPAQGGISPIDPADATDRDRPSSPPSAPRTLLHLPRGLPPAPRLAALEPLDAGLALRIALADPPRAHEAAIGPYRLVVWYSRDRRALVPVEGTDRGPLGEWVPDAEPLTLDTPITGPAAGDPIGAGSAMSLRLGYVDPAGRRGPLTSLSPLVGLWPLRS